jgi:hypothetical protein
MPISMFLAIRLDKYPATHSISQPRTELLSWSTNYRQLLAVISAGLWFLRSGAPATQSDPDYKPSCGSLNFANFHSAGGPSNGALCTVN